MSIFNTLLIVGIIGKKISQHKIIEGIGGTFLKSYYQKTALRLAFMQPDGGAEKHRRIIMNKQIIQNLNFKHLKKEQIIEKNWLKNKIKNIYQFVKIIFENKKMDERKTTYVKLLDKAKDNININ